MTYKGCGNGSVSKVLAGKAEGWDALKPCEKAGCYSSFGEVETGRSLGFGREPATPNC